MARGAARGCITSADISYGAAANCSGASRTCEAARVRASSERIPWFGPSMTRLVRAVRAPCAFVPADASNEALQACFLGRDCGGCIQWLRAAATGATARRRVSQRSSSFRRSMSHATDHGFPGCNEDMHHSGATGPHAQAGTTGAGRLEPKSGGPVSRGRGLRGRQVTPHRSRPRRRSLRPRRNRGRRSSGRAARRRCLPADPVPSRPARP